MIQTRLRSLFILTISFALVVTSLNENAKAQTTTDQKPENNSAAKTLDLAKQVSAATGRPIFAIAGRST